MAIGRLCVKVGKAGKAGVHAEYIARQGRYANRIERGEKLEATEAGNMPAWATHNPQLFWQAADEFERKNGTTYREFEVALPRELTPEQRLDLVRDFVAQELGDRHAYQFAIHTPTALDGGEQPHAHIMFSERQRDGIERDPEQYFKRYNAKAPDRGGARKSFAPLEAQAEMSADKLGRKNERAELLQQLRGRWERTCNAHLERAGEQARIDMRSYRDQGLDRRPELKQMPSQWRAHAQRIAEARQELAQVVPNPRAEVIYLEARRASRDRELAETRAVIERVATRLDARPMYEPGEGDWLRQQPTRSLQEARDALAEAKAFEKRLNARDEREKRAQPAPAPARKVDAPQPQKGEGVSLASLLAQGQHVTPPPPPPVEPPGRDQVVAEAVERARVEHREADRHVIHARRNLDNAEREREQAAYALARGLPEAEATATKAKGQEAGHAAQAARLEREADAWLAQHRIRASIGSTGPADELRAKAKYHADQARTWGEAAKAAEQTAGRLRHGDSEAARALTLAQHSLAGARARADRQFEQMGVYAETIKAGRAYDAQHPPSPRERLLAGMERIEKQQWHEYQRDGERYRRDAAQADKAQRVQWLHDGTGQWHEQPREVVQEHAGHGQGRDPDPPRHRPRGMGGR
jgi:hypothetical protein